MAVVTSAFGPRPTFTVGDYTANDFHFGVDLVAQDGDTLGKIIKSLREGVGLTRDDDPRDAAGLVVRIRHDGYETEYFHTKTNGFRPNTGAQIVAGQGIAQVGVTGLTTGPHLHFVVKKIGARFKYLGFDPRHIYETNHIDPLSDEALAFLNEVERVYSRIELMAFARQAIGDGKYRIEKRQGGDLLVVETVLP